MKSKTPNKKLTKATPDDPAQYKRFLEAAQKARADETEEGADRAFNKVARSKKLHLKST
jgi:hypothetical protein